VGHIGGKDGDAVALGVLHQLRRTIETQGLAIEHGGEKTGRLVPFEPTADIDQNCKAGRVALGEPVFAKALYLLEDAFSK
jgi:hypothetical protein